MAGTEDETKKKKRIEAVLNWRGAKSQLSIQWLVGIF